MTDYRELLLRRIGESGLSQRQFAMKDLYRNERTIRRWISGESPVPEAVVCVLENPVPSPWPTEANQVS